MATKTPTIPPDLKGIPCSDNQWKKLRREGISDIFTLATLMRKRNKPGWMSGKLVTELKAFLKGKDNGAKAKPKLYSTAKTDVSMKPTQTKTKVIARTTRKMIEMTDELLDVYDALSMSTDEDGIAPKELTEILEQFEIQAAETFEQVVSLAKLAEAERDYWKGEKATREKMRKRWDTFEVMLRKAARRYMIVNSEKRLTLASGYEPNITDAKPTVDKGSLDMSKVPEDFLDTSLFDYEESESNPWDGYTPDWAEVLEYLNEHGNQSWCQLKADELTRTFRID